MIFYFVYFLFDLIRLRLLNYIFKLDSNRGIILVNLKLIEKILLEVIIIIICFLFE